MGNLGHKTCVRPLTLPLSAPPSEEIHPWSRSVVAGMRMIPANAKSLRPIVRVDSAVGEGPDQRMRPIAVTVEESLAEPVYFVRQAVQRRLPSNDDRESVD
ncbi:hypothetical protein Mal65_35850 [Crateriforma conspicua]|nr:hypothetical protein Mal65_35850 [Crateriforma conspicua]